LLSIAGIPMAVARSGWSKQGGFEVYLMDGSKGTQLWNIVREAGKPWDIGPGNPNVCERIESGLLSYGGDSDGSTNPFEVRMGKYVDLHVADDVIGIQALRRIHPQGAQRVGDMTNCVWSYRLKRNIGFGLVSARCAVGDAAQVLKDGQRTDARLVALPFL
jgi:glycine cleavage system aminomethyltransferase T